MANLDHVPERLLAAGVPFCAYLATASADGYWMDSGEFIAQATSLGISHPPGHPLAGLLGFAASLLPVGSLAFRVALLSAVMVAIASAFWFAATVTCLRVVGIRSRWAGTLLGLAATWAAAGSYAWWFQAVRPEVYALQGALTAIVVERICALEERWPTPDVRPLYVALLALGFSFTNHHLLGLLFLPALAPTLARVYRAQGLRPLVYCGGLLAVGLSTYAYLPLRASNEPYLNLGSPDSWGRFQWVVTAEAFQKNTGPDVPQPFGERFLDVFVQLGTQLHWSILLLAVVGMYAMFRLVSTRRLAFFFALVLCAHVFVRAWLGFVRSNPDALGYLMPAFGAIGVLAAVAVGVALKLIRQVQDEAARPLAILVALGLLVASLTLSSANAERSSLADFAEAGSAFDDPLRRDLPPRAVVVSYNPQTIFRFWGGEAEDAVRPDVTLVPIPLLGYPGMVDRLLAEAPEVRPLLKGYLVHGQLRQPDLQTLALQRPLFVEMDVRVPPRLYDTLIPSGLYYRVLPEGATAADVTEAAQESEGTWATLYERVTPHLSDPEVRNQLLWHHYNDALFFAGVGDRERARKSVDRGLAINPHAEHLLALQGTLVNLEETGPLDITPFLPGQ